MSERNFPTSLAERMSILKVHHLSSIFVATCKRAAPAAVVPTQASEVSYRQAAEFEPAEAVWLRWSPYEHKQGFSNEQVTLDILSALVP